MKILFYSYKIHDFLFNMICKKEEKMESVIIGKLVLQLLNKKFILLPFNRERAQIMAYDLSPLEFSTFFFYFY